MFVGQVVDCAPGPEGCRANFSSPGQCCTESFTCGQDLEQLPTCQLDGRTYYAGEKMYPEVASAESDHDQHYQCALVYRLTGV